MALPRTVCFVAVLFTFFEVHCAVIQDKVGYKLQVANAKRVKEFACGVPQPRVVQLSEIIHEKFDTDQTIKPHVTVLHRCENAGCCSGLGLTCSPASVQQVELGFMIVPAGSIRVVTATNHTSCSCQPPELPK